MGEATRQISFQDVFQNGRAEIKYTIEGCGNDSKKQAWYILRCDKHDVHYAGTGILRRAARHVSAASHCGNPHANGDDAIREIGIEVLNCTQELADQNNLLADKARPMKAKMGEKPSKTDRTARRRDRGATPITGNPTVGIIYRLYYSHDQNWYAGIRLPLGSFNAVGIAGDFSSTDLRLSAPKCYEPNGKGTLGWAESYQDDGQNTMERSYPVLYFDDEMDIPVRGRFSLPQRNVLAWLAAKDFRPFDFNDRSCKETRGYRAAERYAARLKELGLGQELSSDNPERDDGPCRQGNGNNDSNDVDEGDDSDGNGGKSTG